MVFFHYKPTFFGYPYLWNPTSLAMGDRLSKIGHGMIGLIRSDALDWVQEFNSATDRQPLGTQMRTMVLEYLPTFTPKSAQM